MSDVILGNGRKIGDYQRPYFVAELNTSHFGDLEIAKSMINQAKEVGCDCVKFQSWSAETLYSESYYKENPVARRVVQKFALDNDKLKVLSEHARKVDIDFASTPYSIDEANFLINECDVPFIKIASMELNNHPYLNSLAKLNVPLVLSTGMGTLKEIMEAVEIIKSTGSSQLIILHCTSIYPSGPEHIRLQNILGLRGHFPFYPIGYSDHSLGIEVPIAAVALGACLIEKHFTLDSSRIGMDNQMATEPAEMKDMVAACHKTYESMGGVSRVVSLEEVAQSKKMRRSMIAKVDLHLGQVLEEQFMEFKRPGTGIPPSELQRYIGRKLKHSISAGTFFQPGDFD